MRSAAVALGEIVEIRGGGTPSKSNPAFWNGDIPWVSPKDMKRWDIDDAEDKITSEAIEKSATNVVPPNAILVVNRSGILKHTLPVGIARREVAINQDLKALICNGRAHPDYVAHMLKAAEPIVLKWVRATTADNFSTENLRSLEIPLPQVDEQRRIARILDKADALRRKRKRALELLDGLSQSIFLEMFEPARGCAGMTRSLSDICEVIRDGVHKTPNYVEAGVPFVTVKNIVSGELDLTKTKFVTEKDHLAMTKRVRPEAGDLLVSKDGTIGVPCVVPAGVQPFSIFVSVALLKLRREFVDPTFLAEQIKTKQVQKQIRENSKGIAIRHLHLGDFANLQIRVPNMEDQLRFGSFISKVHELKRRTIRNGTLGDRLFSSLQHRAFSGQL